MTVEVKERRPVVDVVSIALAANLA